MFDSFRKSAIFLLLIFTAAEVVVGQVKPPTKAKQVKKAKMRAAQEAPADALKPDTVDADAAKVEAEAARARKAAELVNLDAVAAPLRALFGGAVVVEERAAVMAVQVQAVDAAEDAPAENDAMTQQFVQQYHPILRAELGFVRLVCSDLTQEQRPKIRVPAEAALKEAARQVAKQQNQMQRGIGVNRNAAAEPSKMIRAAVQKALKETLTEEQMARYTEEAAERTASRKRAAILTLVSRLDGQLFLNEQQRDKITTAVSAKWQDEWEKWLTMMNMYGDRYFPTVPDQCITPHLNPDQRTVWQGIQKIEFGMWWGGGMMQKLDTDGWWGDEVANQDAAANGNVIIRQIFGF